MHKRSELHFKIWRVCGGFKVYCCLHAGGSKGISFLMVSRIGQCLLGFCHFCGFFSVFGIGLLHAFRLLLEHRRSVLKCTFLSYQDNEIYSTAL